MTNFLKNKNWYAQIIFGNLWFIFFRIFINVVLLDVPFFFLRFSILCVYGEITNVLFLLKNLFAIISFVYFWAIRPKIFKNYLTRPVVVNTVELNLANGTNRPEEDFYDNDGHFDDRSRAGTFDGSDVEDHELHDGELYNYNDGQHADSENVSFHENQAFHSENMSYHNGHSLNSHDDHELSPANHIDAHESFDDLHSDETGQVNQLRLPITTEERQVLKYG